MNNNNQKEAVDDDLSSTTGSDFEPVDVQQQEQEPLNDENAQPTLAVSQQQRLRVAEKNVVALNARVHWLEKQLLMEKLKVSEEKLKVAEAKKEKAEAESVVLKARLEQQQKQLEQEVVAKHALELVNKKLLKEWLTTGVGLLRNVSLVRVASNQLITFGGWSIQDGRLKAKKIGDDDQRCVRAEKPFPVAEACPNVQLLFYFEVTVITVKSVSYMSIGLCDANFPFTSTDTYVGDVAGSFAISRCGDYCESGKWMSGHGKGEFASGDVVGCGLLILPTERRIFFTKNGEIWGKPILLGPDDAKADLYPILSTDEPDDEVEFNFSGQFRYPLTHLNVVDG